MVACRRRHGTLCPAVLSRLLHSVPGHRKVTGAAGWSPPPSPVLPRVRPLQRCRGARRAAQPLQRRLLLPQPNLLGPSLVGDGADGIAVRSQQAAGAWRTAADALGLRQTGRRRGVSAERRALPGDVGACSRPRRRAQFAWGVGSRPSAPSPGAPQGLRGCGWCESMYSHSGGTLYPAGPGWVGLGLGCSAGCPRPVLEAGASFFAHRMRWPGRAGG